MGPAPLPFDEEARLAVLARHEPAPDLGDPVLDGLVRLAAQLAGTPIALLSLVGRDEQVFAARTGLGLPSTSRDVSFCAHAIADPGTPLLVPDARADARFAANPLVTGDPRIGFYAGVPLREDAHALGTLCVIDRRPRELAPEVLAQLEVLAGAAAAHLRGRRAERDRARLATILRDAPDAFVAMDTAGRVVSWNLAASALFGWSEEEALGRLVSELIVPPHLAPVHDAGVRALADPAASHVLGRPLELEARHRDGRPLEIEMTIAAAPDGGGHVFTAFSRDIADRKATERRTERHAEDLEVLAALTRGLSSSGDVDQTAAALVAAARERTGAAAAQLWQPGVDGRLVVTHGDAAGAPAADAARAWREGAPVVGAETWCHPVQDEDGPSAVLSVRWAHPPDGGRERFARLMQVLADHAAAALARAQLLADLGQLATTDELTGLPNRRAWRIALGRTHAAARRHGTPFALALLDLDHFKAYNDEHGHVAGDALLREAAAAWVAQLRPSDVLARWGGEEFAVLLPHADEAGAREVVERLRGAVPGGCTCSAGIVVGAQGEDPAGLLEHADVALYAAKAAGRDRAVVWQPVAP